MNRIRALELNIQAEREILGTLNRRLDDTAYSWAYQDLEASQIRSQGRLERYEAELAELLEEAYRVFWGDAPKVIEVGINAASKAAYSRDNSAFWRVAMRAAQDHYQAIGGLA